MPAPFPLRVSAALVVFTLLPPLAALALEGSQPTFLYASQFDRDPELKATSAQTVVFESSSLETAARFQLDAGTHRFCIESAQGYFTTVVVESLADQPVKTISDRNNCARAEIPSGIYRVRPLHADEPTPAGGDVALLRIDPPGAPLLGPDGLPRKGYWGIIPVVPDNDAQPLHGRLRALAMTSSNSPEGLDGLPVAADMSSMQMDEYSLFKFGSNLPALLSDPKTFFDYDRRAFPFEAAGTVLVRNGACSAATDCGTRPHIKVTDRKDSSTFLLSFANEEDKPDLKLAFAPTPLSLQTLKISGSSPHFRQPAILSLALRFFPDSAQMDALREGEAGLFQLANYGGKAAVFSLSTPDLTALSSSVNSIEENTYSLKLGPGTAALLYAGPNYSGAVTSIETDWPQLGDAIGTQSIRLSSLTLRTLSEHRCEGCNFEGIDLSGLDLAGFDLKNARLTKVNLTNTRLNGARLTGTDLSGATLSCTDFSGADADHRNDLRKTKWNDIQIIQQPTCRTSFAYTRVRSDALPLSALKYLNITGTLFDGLPRSTNMGQGFGKQPGVVDTHGLPKPGFWAIAPPYGNTGQNQQGRLRITQPFQKISDQNPNDAWIVADYTSQQMDGQSLFALPQASTFGGILGPPNDTVFNSYTDENQNVYLTVGQGYCCGKKDVTIADWGNYNFLLTYGTGVLWVDCCARAPLPTFRIVHYPGQMEEAIFSLMFRYFPSGTQSGDLEEGEIALFQSDNFKGKAAVFAPGPGLGAYPEIFKVNLTALASDLFSIDGTAQSIKVANNTTLFWTSPKTNRPVFLMTDALSNDERLRQNGTPTGVISAIPITDIINEQLVEAGTDCQGCSLAGVTIPGGQNGILQLGTWNFADANFAQAQLSNINMSGANLSGAHFNSAQINSVYFTGANLSSTDFSGASLNCVSLHGSDANNLLDLTQVANGAMFNFKGCPANLSDLSYTKLSLKQVPPSMWKYVNLTGAVFVDLQDGQQLSGKAQPLDLTGAHLGQMSLQNVVLDYALMSGVDLTKATLNHSSLQHVDLSQALLYGANLTSANLDGADMYGAFLTKPPSSAGSAANLRGAFLRNVNLSSAKLSGANFSSSSFFGVITSAGLPCTNLNQFTDQCATASGATMDSTEFGDAYLAGTDFSNTTAQGVRFGNAILTGASFKLAKLSADLSGSDTGFSGAFLQGTDFTSTTLLNRISLANAFVDFTAGGNTFFVSLTGQHTTFPGYWGAEGNPVCTQVVYRQSTLIPASTSNDTCPNGNSYAGGCGPASPDGSNLNWKSPVNLAAVGSYLSNSTYTPAANPVCTVDPRWSPIQLLKAQHESPNQNSKRTEK
ncbi:MAG: pentapeptide repeat-containing protein [Acidobacteriota bacterium]|nr:pentapeptide repeat-containing protein [Acidobacteriota bacterium]